MLSKFKFQSSKCKENRAFSIKSKSIFFLLSLFCAISSQAQCAMCRASLESEGNSTKLEAVNDGIVYLMVIPYVLVGIVGYLIFRMYNKKKEEKIE
jgi:phosphatidylglycerophosphatase A